MEKLTNEQILEMAKKRRATLTKVMDITKRDADILYKNNDGSYAVNQYSKRMFEEVSYAITDISIMDNIIKDLEREFAKKK
jgi:hypothetical protein